MSKRKNADDAPAAGTSVEQRPYTYIWLDCDPGHDDAMAIVLATHYPDDARQQEYVPHLVGVSTVCGNAPLEATTENALRVLHLVGKDDVPVFKGADKPLVRPRRNCPEIHGAGGLDGVVIPPADREANPGKAVHAIAEAVTRCKREHDARGRPKDAFKFKLVATGALTNVALFLSVYPELIPALSVVFMGGSMGRGNTGPVAEFNMQCDPEAAKCVFESGVDLTMVPLELTHTAIYTERVRDVWKKIIVHPSADGPWTPSDEGEGGIFLASYFLEVVDAWMQFFAKTYEDVFGFEDGPPLHDPCAVLYAIDPELFEVEKMRVDVECASDLSAGQTVCDFWKQSGKPANCAVATRFRDTGGDWPAKEFWDIMIGAIYKADDVSFTRPRRRLD